MSDHNFKRARARRGKEKTQQALLVFNYGKTGMNPISDTACDVEDFFESYFAQFASSDHATATDSANEINWLVFWKIVGVDLFSDLVVLDASFGGFKMSCVNFLASSDIDQMQ